MRKEERAGIWLGTAASALALLAFLGIGGLDDLRRAVETDSQAKDRRQDEACAKADQAWNNHLRNMVTISLSDSRAAQVERTYVKELWKANDAAAEGELKQATYNHIHTLNAYVTALERKVPLKKLFAISDKAQERQDVWRKICHPEMAHP
ncbi:hypothetical protein U9R90_27020 [Streptomyces sp. E11-3]|uniref:hypothetical protein n=1 Tax=Streptomyces sp. E11-3 TaxID=3110112 RepID=UPI00397F7810